MRYGNDLLGKADYKIESVERSLKDIEYRGIFESPKRTEYDIFLPAEALAVERVGKILSVAALAPPHGLHLLTVLPPLKLPELPELPDIASIENSVREQLRTPEYIKTFLPGELVRLVILS